jgi:archaellum component FlaC
VSPSELEAIVAELAERVDNLEALLATVEEDERPTLAEARAALLARTKERRTR